MEQQDYVVDLSFLLRGTSIPADHGYALYSAISRHLPWLHGDRSVGVHPVQGRLIGQRQLALNELSRLVLRLPASKIPEAICLAGKRLDLEGALLMVGVPTVQSLLPHSSLRSRLVIIKGFTEPTPFLEAVLRQLDQLGVNSSVALVPHRRGLSVEAQIGSRETVVRRTLRIRDKEVVGFAVQAVGLGPQDSLALQATGLGGRRRFGCGIFLPTPDVAE